MSVLISSFDRSELRSAYDSASEINKTLRDVPGTVLKVESQFVLDLSTLVLEAIDCIENNNNPKSDVLHRIARNALCSELPLLKIGYSLSVLLEKLLTERHATCHQHKASSSRTSEPDVVVNNTIDDPIEVKEEPLELEEFDVAGVSTEPKEEPVEIKLEEPDDFETEVKQEEEEPMADVFCPATGFSRPVDETGEDMEMDSVDDVKPPVLPFEKDAAIVQDPAKVLAERIAKLCRHQPAQAAPRDKLRCAICDRLRECYLCSELTDKYWSIPASGTRRDAFLERVFSKSPADNARVMKLRGNENVAYFCLNHVIAKRMDNVPLNVMKAVAKGSTMIMKNTNEGPVMLYCDLCGNAQSPFLFSPKNPLSAKRFFDNLCKLTKQEQVKIEPFLKSRGMQAVICTKHTKPVLIKDQLKDELNERVERMATKHVEAMATTSKKINFNVEYLFEHPKHNKQAKICHLCGDRVHHFVISPAYAMFAQKFFASLIDVTAYQKLKIDQHLRQNKRATVCMKHIKKSDQPAPVPGSDNATDEQVAKLPDVTTEGKPPAAGSHYKPIKRTLINEPCNAKARDLDIINRLARR